MHVEEVKHLEFYKVSEKYPSSVEGASQIQGKKIYDVGLKEEFCSCLRIHSIGIPMSGGELAR